MTPINLILTVVLLLATAIVVALFDRWAHRKGRRWKAFLADLEAADQAARSADDCRQVDILKRGEILPWPRAE